MNDPLAEEQWWFVIDEALKDPVVLVSLIIFISLIFLVLIVSIYVSPKEREQ